MTHYTGHVTHAARAHLGMGGIVAKRSHQGPKFSDTDEATLILPFYYFIDFIREYVNSSVNIDLENIIQKIFFFGTLNKRKILSFGSIQKCMKEQLQYVS